MKGQPIEQEPAIFQFVWKVPTQGYEWIDRATPAPELGTWTPVQSRAPYLLPSGQRARCTLPLIDTPDLFLTFLSLEPTQDAIVEFANRYGWLGCTVPVQVKKGGAVSRAETLHRWQKEIRAMQRAWSVWGFLQEKDPHTQRYELAQRFRRSDTGVMVFRDASYLERIDNPAGQWKPGDLIGPARLFVLLTINKHLAHAASPCLLFDQGNRMRPFVKPHNLVGSLWVELFQAVSGAHPFIRCQVCKKWMDASQHRASKKVHDRCGRNVRQQRWRKRVRERARKKGKKHGTIKATAQKGGPRHGK